MAHASFKFLTAAFKLISDSVSITTVDFDCLLLKKTIIVINHPRPKNTETHNQIGDSWLLLVIATLSIHTSPGTAFKAYWHEKGVTGIAPYKNNVPGIPHVCAKVPTAGGKTFIAVNAIKAIFDALAVHHPERSKLVVWLVPSLSILEQTVRNLDNPEHPYRRRLNQLFSNRVAVFEKRDLLMGAGFSADTVSEQLSIIVMSFGSLKAKNKEDRKIFQDNAYLASFAINETEEQASLLPGYDPTALINVIRGLLKLNYID